MATANEHACQQVPQRILVLRDFCIRPAGANCRSCEDICPAEAIDLPKETSKSIGTENGAAGANATPSVAAPDSNTLRPPQVDANACTLCGICQGTCDAFTSTGMKVADVAAAARRVALSDNGREVIITCEHNVAEGFEPASNVIALPCLAMVPAELWTQLLAQGANLAIALELGICDSCTNCKRKVGEDAHASEPIGENCKPVTPDDAPHEESERAKRSNADALLTAAISQAETWTGKSVGFATEIPAAADEGLFANLARAGSSGNKRDAFTDVFTQIKDASSGALRKRTDPKLQAFIEQNDRLKSRSRLGLGNGSEFNRFATRGRMRTTMFPRRQMLLAAIDAEPEIAERIELALSETDTGKCRNDLRCARVCPTGARRPDAVNGALSFEARLCIGCGICEQVCRHDAIALATAPASELAC